MSHGGLSGSAARDPDAGTVPEAEAGDAQFSGLSIASWLEGVNTVDVTAGDGLLVRGYYAGNPADDALILINPVGVSMLLLSPLLRFLSRDYFVVSWETRGLPSSQPGAEPSLTVDDHLNDAQCLLEHFNIQRADVVAFCSGTSIALPMLVSRRIGANKAVLISPSVLIDGEVAMTNYQRTVIPIWQDVMRKGKDYCAIISNFMRAERPPTGDVQREIDYVNRLPFLDGDSTYQYAKLHAHLNEIRHAAIFSELQVPVLLVHARDDELIHFDVSRFIEGRLRRSRFHVIEAGGHFAICTHTEVHHAIRAYLRDLPARPAEHES